MNTGHTERNRGNVAQNEYELAENVDAHSTKRVLYLSLSMNIYQSRVQLSFKDLADQIISEVFKVRYTHLLTCQSSKAVLYKWVHSGGSFRLIIVTNR